MGRTREELCERLAEQYGLLRSSAASFDNGNEAEALRLAVTVRVLVHDTESSHSVLGQLEVKDRFWVSETSFLPFRVGGAEPREVDGMIHRVAFPTAALVSLGPGRYFPHCSDRDLDTRKAPQCRFADWWSMPIAVDPGNFTVTRKRLVLDLANREGGAHVDLRPPRPSMHALDRTNFEDWEEVHNGDPPDLDFGRQPGTPFTGSVARASMRQVADEMGISLMHIVGDIRRGVTDPARWAVLTQDP